MEPKEYLISNMFLYSNAGDTKHTPVALKNGYKTNVLYMERHSDYKQENILALVSHNIETGQWSGIESF